MVLSGRFELLLPECQKGLYANDKNEENINLRPFHENSSDEIRAGSSAWNERLTCTQEVGGSNPPRSTKVLGCSLKIDLKVGVFQFAVNPSRPSSGHFIEVD